MSYDYQTFTLQTYGGISRYYSRLSEELLNRGEAIKIFAPYHCNQLLRAVDDSIVKGKRIYSTDFSKPIAFALMLTNQVSSREAIRKWKPVIVHETYFAILRSGPKKYAI